MMQTSYKNNYLREYVGDTQPVKSMFNLIEDFERDCKKKDSCTFSDDEFLEQIQNLIDTNCPKNTIQECISFLNTYYKHCYKRYGIICPNISKLQTVDGKKLSIREWLNSFPSNILETD